MLERDNLLQINVCKAWSYTRFPLVSRLNFERDNLLQILGCKQLWSYTWYAKEVALGFHWLGNVVSFGLSFDTAHGQCTLFGGSNSHLKLNKPHDDDTGQSSNASWG